MHADANGARRLVQRIGDMSVAIRRGNRGTMEACMGGVRLAG
jgi:hypothetical protein